MQEIGKIALEIAGKGETGQSCDTILVPDILVEFLRSKRGDEEKNYLISATIFLSWIGVKKPVQVVSQASRKAGLRTDITTPGINAAIEPFLGTPKHPSLPNFHTHPGTSAIAEHLAKALGFTIPVEENETCSTNMETNSESTCQSEAILSTKQKNNTTNKSNDIPEDSPSLNSSEDNTSLPDNGLDPEGTCETTSTAGTERFTLTQESELDRLAQLSKNAWRLYFILKLEAKGRDYCSPPYDVIVEKLCVSDRMIRKLFNELMGVSLVQRSRKGKKEQRGSFPEYHLPYHLKKRKRFSGTPDSGKTDDLGELQVPVNNALRGTTGSGKYPLGGTTGSGKPEHLGESQVPVNTYLGEPEVPVNPDLGEPQVPPLIDFKDYTKNTIRTEENRTSFDCEEIDKTYNYLKSHFSSKSVSRRMSRSIAKYLGLEWVKEQLKIIDADGSAENPLAVLFHNANQILDGDAIKYDEKRINPKHHKKTLMDCEPTGGG